MNAFKLTCDTFQLKCNVSDAAWGRYDNTGLYKGMKAAVRLISYWTYGTRTFGTHQPPFSERGIRDSIWVLEGSLTELEENQDQDTHFLETMKYHQNVRALRESISTRSWLKAWPQPRASGFVTTDVNINQVAMYLKKEYPLLSKSLKGRSTVDGTPCMQELREILFEPLQKAAEEFKTGDLKKVPVMKGDPDFVSLVEKEWIESFDQCYNPAHQPLTTPTIIATAGHNITQPPLTQTTSGRPIATHRSPNLSHRSPDQYQLLGQHASSAHPNVCLFK